MYGLPTKAEHVRRVFPDLPTKDRRVVFVKVCKKVIMV